MYLWVKKISNNIFLLKKFLGKKYKINIIGHPIIRDKNKIALSTRNKLLNKNQFI